MVHAPVRSIIPSLKLGDYLSIQAHKPHSITHGTQYSLHFNNNILLCDISDVKITHGFLQSNSGVVGWCDGAG